MTQRAANYSIKGYLYQFYRTIEQILQSSLSALIIIEGIEDIQTQSELIQCKYHEATKLVPSKIYEPVGKMLKHFIDNPSSGLRYCLYAHFGAYNTTNATDIFTKNFLKLALANVNSSVSVTDEILERFLQKFTFNPGLKFEDLQKSLFSRFQSEFLCSEADVAEYYFPHAIALIAEYASRPDSNARTISKKLFKKKIDNKYNIFDRWQSEFYGKRQYLRNIRERLQKLDALSNKSRRFLFISTELANSTSGISLKKFIQNLVNRYSVIGQLYNAKLWTVVIDITKEELLGLKKHLVANSIYYNDGYEDILFSPDYFHSMPIKNAENNKATKTSHHIRIISAATFKNKIGYFSTAKTYPDSFIDCSPKAYEFYPETDTTISFGVTELKNLSELFELLKP